VTGDSPHAGGPYRDEQGAWYDVLRDIMPPSRDLGPTVRLRDGNHAFCLIDRRDMSAVEAFSQLTSFPRELEL
jgi:hypothetical protein